MTPEQAQWCIGKTVILEWPSEFEEGKTESAVALIEAVRPGQFGPDVLVSDAGLDFLVEAMQAPREAIQGQDY